MKMFTGISQLIVVLFLVLSATLLAENRFSVASGTWETTATWSATRGGAPGAAVPAATDTVYITSGTKVSITASSKKCYNLIVENGGVLFSNQAQPTGSQQYMTVSGDFVKNDGIIGYDPANPTVNTCISFNTVKDIVFSGSGISKISRIRPNTDVSNTTTTIDQDLTLTYYGSSGTGGVGWYGFQGVGTGNKLLIKAGRTLSCVDYCYIATNSSVDSDGPTTIIQVDGTLSMPGAGCTLGLRAKDGATATLIVNGTVDLGRTLKPTGTTGVNSVITVNAGGKLKVGTAGVGVTYFNTPTQTVTGAGSFEFAGGTLQIGAPAGLDPANGPVRTTTRTFSQTGAYSFMGNAAAMATGSDFPSNVRYLSLNDSAGTLTLTNNLTADSLDLSNGFIATGSKVLSLSPNGTLSRTSGFVIGNLQKQVPTGAATTAFEVGSAIGYSPISLSFNNVTTSGNITVTTKEAVHPSAATPGANLKRYWTITNSGTAFDKYSGTFTYLPADFSGDIAEATDESSLKIVNYDGTAWKTPTAGINTPGSTNDGGSLQVTGLTSFGDFAVVKSERYLLTEDFTSAAGTLLTAAGWAQSGTGATTPITVTASGLSLGNYIGSGIGNAVALTFSGQDLFDTLKSPVNSGSVYLSFLMNVASAGSGDYFIALSPSTTQNNYTARFHLKSSGTGYQVGISKSSEVTGGAKYGNTVYNFNSTNLVVVKYTFVPADSNDITSVYVFPSTLPATEPATPEIDSYNGFTKPDAADLGFVTLRQGGGTGVAPVLTVDGIRVSTKWDITGSTPISAVASFSTKTVAFGDVLVGTSKTDSSVVVTNTGGALLNITAVTSGNPKVTVTPATASINAGAAQKFVVTYTPTAAQADAAKLVFTSNGVVTSDTVNVTGNGTSVPADTTPIVTIAKAREDLNNDFIPDNLNTVYKVKGVVTSIDFTASTTTNNNYFIQDATAGILLYAKPKLNKLLNVGDSVLVKGKITQYRGVTEIATADTLVETGGSVEVLKTGAKVPAPVVISVKDLNSEKYEGSLVTVKNLTKTLSSKAWPVEKSIANITVAAGTDSTILFIDSDTDIDGQPEPTWPQDITGVATQYSSASTVYNDGYEIQPRSMSDFKTPAVETILKISQARALTANSKVTVTGTIISPNLSSSRCGYYISDATAGIYLYGGPKIAFEIGDSIKVTGWLLPYNGLLEIADSSTSNLATVTKIASGSAPKPIELTIAQFNSTGEANESRLVKVKNLSKLTGSAAWPTTSTAVNMSFTTAGTTDTLSVRLNQYTEVPGKAEPSWPSNITGILTQFAASGVGGYQLVPRFMTDFEKVTSVKEVGAKIPETYSIEQNYPNPFNPATSIRYSLPSASNVRIVVYNLIGEVISEVVNRVQSAGYHEVSFNAGNLSSGIYLYSIIANASDGSKEFRSVKKMILMK